MTLHLNCGVFCSVLCPPFGLFINSQKEILSEQQVHAAVHPVCFTSMERAPCVILIVGVAHRGTDILEEPLAELPGPDSIHSGVGLAGLILACGILGVHFLLEVGCHGYELGLVVWDRLVPQSCVFIISV